ncbi:MAG: LysM peptidoglycan-binding domain-containing protein [Pseudomonadota bacterium]
MEKPPEVAVPKATDASQEVAELPAATDDEPVENTNLWDRIRDGFALPEFNDPRTEAQLAWYVNHPGYMERVCERARPFLYDIVEVLEQRDMPLELALLPVVESAFQTYAYSHGQAAGLWQFVPATGRHMGLEQNWWYDGRRDPYAATRAAANYLERLNGMVGGDWLLSLAAYNAGPGTVRKAMRRNQRANRPSDFWNLSLPRETRDYVPKLLALQKIVNDPTAYGLELCNIPDEPAIERVVLKGQLDLTIAAELAALNVDDLYSLNPGFNRWATAPGGPHHLILPAGHGEAFKQAEVQLSQDQRLRWREHRVGSGDTLSEIAQKYHTTVREIRQNNSLSGAMIRVGQRLRIPTAAAKSKQYAMSEDQRQARRQSGKDRVLRTVRPGDSWWTIAREYGVTTRTLARWNGRSPLDTLHPGQKLVIKGGPSTSRVASAPGETLQKVYYPVRRGDSLSTIADKFNVGLSDLRRWNQGASQRKYLQPGQKLVIYVDVTQQSPN